MEISNWLMFASIITLASVSPGPNVLAVVVNTLSDGVRGAIFTIIGNLIALFTIALVAALGVGALLQSAPSVFSVMKLAGGVYLAWMGFKMLKGSFSLMPPIDVADEKRISEKSNALGLIFRAMLISYSNPKSILFLSAVFPALLTTTGSTSIQFGVMFLTIISLVTVIHGFYAILALRLRGHLVSSRTRRWMSRISGISFMGFGAGFVVDSQR